MVEGNEEPPSEGRDLIQLSCAGRLLNRVMHGDITRNVIDGRRFVMVFICHSIGSKFGLGFHYGQGLCFDDEEVG